MSQKRSLTERPATERSPSALNVRIFTELPELASIARAWDDIVFSETGALPTSSYAWVASYLEHSHPPDRPWLCMAAFEDGRLVGVWPLVRERARVLGRRATILRQPGDAHSRSIDLVVRPGYDQPVHGAFRAVLDEQTPDWFSVEFDWLEQNSPLLADAGVRPLPPTTVARKLRSHASVVPTDRSWEDYTSELSRNFRRRLTKLHRKTDRLGSVRTELFSGADADPQLLDRFMPIEASGWKGRAGSAIAEDPGRVAFYRALCRRLHRRGALDWHFLLIKGEDLAGHLAVRSGRRLSIFKIGYLESHAENSPGVLLLEHALKAAFEDPAIGEVNFLTDRSWHDHWRPEKRPYYDVRIYPNRPFPLVAGAWPKQARIRLARISLLRKAFLSVRRNNST